MSERLSPAVLNPLAQRLRQLWRRPGSSLPLPRLRRPLAPRLVQMELPLLTADPSRREDHQPR